MIPQDTHTHTSQSPPAKVLLSHHSFLPSDSIRTGRANPAKACLWPTLIFSGSLRNQGLSRLLQNCAVHPKAAISEFLVPPSSKA